MRGLLLLLFAFGMCDCLQVRNVPETTLAARPLRKGQRWNMGDQQLRIYHVGILLVEFRVFKLHSGVPEHKLGRSSLETVSSVQDYLEKHQAVLETE